MLRAFDWASGRWSIVLFPPDDAKRIRNMLDPAAQARLPEIFKQIFGRRRWPSRN